MDKIFLFVTLLGKAIVVCRQEQIQLSLLPDDIKIFELGIAHPNMPPGRTLMTVTELSTLFTANVSPIIVKEING